jgi:hypothetical protein
MLFTVYERVISYYNHETSWSHSNIRFSASVFIYFFFSLDTTYMILGPLHVLWQVSFGCWVSWSISSWQEYYKSVFFSYDKWCVAELLFLSLINWGLNFLPNECSQSSQIYLAPERLRKKFVFQSCKFSINKIDQNINFAKLPGAK